MRLLRTPPPPKHRKPPEIEESKDESEQSLLNRFLDKYLPEGHSIEDIERFAALTERGLRRKSGLLIINKNTWSCLLSFNRTKII